VSAFFNDFNAALEQAAVEFGESWAIVGSVVTWPAIAIDTVEASTQATPGGKLAVTKTAVLISRKTELESGVKEGTIVVVRGARLRVGPIRREGDASCWLECGPAGIDVPRR
jgi:hypothetical protein